MVRLNKTLLVGIKKRVSEPNNANWFAGKRILVFGLGLHGGGVGTIKYLASKDARITVTDLHSPKELEPSLRALAKIKGIRYVLGEHRERDFLSADLILKNPGIPPNSPYLQLALDHNKPITSDMGIFFRSCPALIIGVTGTRGKSTTSYLIWLFLQAWVRHKPRKKKTRVFVGGNIRTSALEFLDRLTENDIVVLELSSFQLDDLIHDTWLSRNSRRSPHIAVLTNIMRDHLNWHGTMRQYIEAKRGIVRYQSEDNIVFANGSDPVVRRMIAGAHSRVRFPKLPPDWRNVVDEKLGNHYRSSVALAVAVAKHFGTSQSILKKTFLKFRGLEGREQQVAVIRGIHFVNDTTATVPDAAIAAIQRFRKKAGVNRLILIAGGSDKKLIFHDFARAIARDVDALILLPGTATKQLKTALSRHCEPRRVGAQQSRGQKKDKSCQFEVHEVKNMYDAIRTAYRLAQKGDWLVLSPGAASFGLFLNEFDRGEKFNAEIKKLL